jgi:hypothetical protein
VTLANSAARLQEEIGDLNRLERMKEEIETYQTRVRMLRGPLVQLQALATILAAFRSRGIPVRFDGTKATSLKEQAVEFRDAFEQDPESIVRRSQTTHYSFYHGLENLPSGLKGCLDGAWKGYVESKVGPEQTAMLETMARVEKLAPVVATVRRLYDAVGQIEASLPQCDADFARVDEIAEELRVAKTGLDGVQKEVLLFLQSAWSGAGAELGQLTSEVLHWLESYDMKGHVKVFLR